MRPLLLGPAVLALMFAATSPASALCAACNATIRLDAGLAGCFASRAADELKTLAGNGRTMVIVDLKKCTTRGSLPTGNPSDGPPQPLDLMFAVDAAGIQCLTDLIGGMDDTALTPNHVFDLAKDCAAN